jgi:hypothetical protein
MSISYRIDTTEWIIYEKFEGSVTVDELIHHIEKQEKDPLNRPGLPTIADMNQTSGEWGYLDMVRFRNYVIEKTRGRTEASKWAVVCDLVQTNFVVNTFELLSEAVGAPVKIKIFKTEEEARAWVLDQEK